MKIINTQIANNKLHKTKLFYLYNMHYYMSASFYK